MPRSERRSELSRQIASALNTQTRRAAPGGRNDLSLATRSVVYSSMALLALGPLPAAALGLGEVQLRSGLGQPLRASIPARLASGEALDQRCISLPASSAGGLKAPPETTIRLPAAASGPGDFEIELSSARPLYEPMYELTLKVSCGGVPTILRQYVLMLDLPMAAPAAVVQTNQAREALTVPNLAPAPRLAQRPRLQRSADPIQPGISYRVREGDTLSTIAERIDGRPANSTWQLADLIFAANPRAFVRGNPDLIKLGSTISIPTADQWSTDGPVISGAAEMSQATALVVPAVTAPADLPSTTPATAENPVAAANPAPAAPVPAPAVMNSEIATPAARDMASPFLDERPAPATSRPEVEVAAPVSEPAPLAESAVTPAPPVLPAIESERATSRVNPLLAVLAGILLGFGLSMLLLRGRLIDGAVSLLRGRQRKSSETPLADQTFGDTDEWLGDTVEPVSVNNPAEQTYVVEVSDDEPTSHADDAAATRTAGHDSALFDDQDEPITATAATADDVMLSELFDDDLSHLPAESDLPVEAFMDDDMDSPAALAPTAELPHFNEVTEDEMLAGTVEQPTAELVGLEDEADETAQLDMMTLSQTAEDTKLSATLREALTLLERDYEDELTASQVIDREAISKALAEGSDEVPASPRRKRNTG